MKAKDLATINNSHTIWFEGQSNCGGFNQPTADTTTYPPMSGCYIFDPQIMEWQQLQRNKNNSGCPFGFLGFFGSELKLMELLQAHYGSDQYMIKYAQGGTSLSGTTSDEYNWSPDSTSNYMFKGSVANYQAAMDNFPCQKIFPKIYIWWQGEDDTDPINSAAYASNFNKYWNEKKNRCGLSDVLVIQVGLSNNQTAYGSTGRDTVNAAKISFAIHGNKFISTDDAEVQASGVHFTGVGYEDIAQRIFDVIITML